ncbi:hypothetical protein L2X99_16305 [Microbacterium sp. KUDC0406]|uniref:hypothetical protein n=1 Tax=Microbacterium sp. KUDC0406 TaxID=2909588 RepID=UPI001F186181|nr:hypothetical protein [Microbacterium sp. KUDC0406]UJP09911.1 hypothetical protein L2X99_16305 [Microbacterium sp. KUDC0406]
MRSVVDHDHLIGLPGLLDERAQASPQQDGVVVGRDDDAQHDRRVWAHGALSL